LKFLNRVPVSLRVRKPQHVTCPSSSYEIDEGHFSSSDARLESAFQEEMMVTSSDEVENAQATPDCLISSISYFLPFDVPKSIPITKKVSSSLSSVPPKINVFAIRTCSLRRPLHYNFEISLDE